MTALEMELVATCVPFFGGLPILFPEALIRGILMPPPGCCCCRLEEASAAAERWDADAPAVAREAGAAGGLKGRDFIHLDSRSRMRDCEKKHLTTVRPALLRLGYWFKFNVSLLPFFINQFKG